MARRLLVQGLDTSRVGDIGQLEKGLPALGRGLLAGLLPDVGDAHLRPFGREEDRRLATDATGGAGDDGHLAVEASH